MHTQRTVLFGIDGASFTLLNQLMNDGFMPNLKQISKEGFFSRMESPWPDNSAVSWSSIMTGTNPGEHGIYGFTELIPGTYTMKFPNYLSLKASPFWLQNSEEKHIIINLPFTYPAQSLNGMLISGFVSPSLDRSVYPETLLSKVKEYDYRIDADLKRIYQSKEMFCDDVLDVLQTRTKLYRDLFQNQDWDVFMIVFTGSDRLGHYVLDAYEQRESPIYEKFIDYYQIVDAEIGWVFGRLNEQDQLVMMSDHGMEVIDTEVNLNSVLQSQDLLHLPEEREQTKYTDILPETKAFVMEPGRVYLNYRDTYPNGSVGRQESDGLLADLEGIFKSIEFEGRKVIRDVFRRDQIYHGEQSCYAPDLVLVQNPGISLRGVLGKEQIFSEPDIIKGVHQGDDAFVYIRYVDSIRHEDDVPQAQDILRLAQRMEAV